MNDDKTSLPRRELLTTSVLAGLGLLTSAGVASSAAASSDPVAAVGAMGYGEGAYGGVQ